jgi:hypothetical protein
VAARKNLDEDAWVDAPMSAMTATTAARKEPALTMVCEQPGELDNNDKSRITSNVRALMPSVMP